MRTSIAGRRLRRQAVRIADDVADMVADVFVEAIRTRTGSTRRAASRLAWLLGIAANLMASSRRARAGGGTS